MAGSMFKGLLRLNVAANSLLRNTFINGSRLIYSRKSLGIVGYENSRLKYRSQFINVENSFRSRMEEICNDENSMIFTEDLKAMLHLAQKKPEDIELVKKMIVKFNKQNKEMRFGTYVFGPVVMRTLYYLNEAQSALEIFTDPEMKSFFDQLMSQQILLSLLYKNEMYADIRKLYESIVVKETGIYGSRRSLLNQVMAACYKEDTKEAYEFALGVWKDLNETGHKFLRRFITYFAALALKQGNPEVALETLSVLREQRYVDVRCLKVLTLLALNRHLDIIPILRMSIENDRGVATKETYFIDVIQKLESSLEGINMEYNSELSRLLLQLKQHDLVTSLTLEEHLSREIDMPMRRRIDGQQAFSTQGMSSMRSSAAPFQRRTGIRDLL